MSSYNDTVDILTKCIRNREDHCCIPCSSMLWLDDAFGIAKINSPKSFDVRSIKYRKEDAGMTVFPQYGLSSRQYNETLVECNKRASEILSVVWDEDPLSFIRNLYVDSCKRMRYLIEADSYSIVGPLLHNEGVCEGFAKYINYFCQIAGIESTAAVGYLKSDASVGHAWNQIRLNGNWYNLDVTSGLSLSHGKRLAFDYCLVDDDKIMRTHLFSSPSKGCF